MEASDPHYSPIKEEFEGALLGDERRNQRLMRVVNGLVKAPTASFPNAADSDSELEGTYRFLNNPKVTFTQLWQPHQRATLARVAEYQQVLVIHDTSQFTFSGDRDGLGPVQSKTGVKGFLGHFSLVLADTPLRTPLGVIAFKSFVRSTERKGRRSHKDRLSDPDRESLRWWEQAQESQRALNERARAVHVMDREADDYLLLSKLVEHQHSFVIRIRGDRATTTPIEGAKGHLRVSDALAQTEHCLEREVALSRRVASTPSKKKIHPSRSRRMATLRVSAESIEILRPMHLPSALAPKLRLNVVRVYEANAPVDEPPVEWMLITDLPIERIQQVEQIVDIYRARWIIEEFFKALKTGCSFEKRQLESLHALLNALAIFIPIAWRLLRLRSVARAQPKAPALDLLSHTQLAVLRTTERANLPETPSAVDALTAVAALGGHIKNNGDPGWQVLGRGFEKLLLLEQGWIAAMAQRSDQ